MHQRAIECLKFDVKLTLEGEKDLPSIMFTLPMNQQYFACHKLTPVIVFLTFITNHDVNM